MTIDDVASELSTEAKMLLTEAAASSDGFITYLHISGGEVIQTNSRNMLPDNRPRTIAFWMGGLNELLSRGYINTTGGETFTVTNEGYTVADKLSEFDWREEITSVATRPETRLVASELSTEARDLLKAAAADEGEGSIMHLYTAGGELIKAGRENKYYGRKPREIARWKGGINDLLSRGYIEVTGQNGDEFFRVTREGYIVADELLDE